MVQIAGKPFTQLTNLNILDELRVRGQLLTGVVIVEISANYTADVDDDFIIAVSGIAKTVTLPLASAASHSVTIKNRVIDTIVTVDPSGSDMIDDSSSDSLQFNQAITLVPYSSGWAKV